MALASKYRRILRALFLVIATVFVGLQFFPVDRENPKVASPLKTTNEVQSVLTRACWDCHSNETQWPWYSYVAPLSFWISDHVAEGRKHLNFSDWPTFDFEAQEHIFREIREQVSEKTMPLESYVRGHPEASLSDEDRRVLLDWAQATDSF